MGAVKKLRVAALALGLAAAAVLRPVAPAWGADARVQYLSSTNVYVDAGSADGLVEGATLTVRRGGKDLAKLVAVYVAEHSTSCRIDSQTEPLHAGDVCSFTPSAAADSAATPASAGGAAAAGGATGAAGPRSTGAATKAPMSEGIGWTPPRHVTGQIMTLYTRTSDDGGSYENPSLLGDLRWSGRRQEQLSLRVSAAQPASHAITDLPGVVFDETQTRIYEVAAQYRTPSGRLEAAGGRYLAPRLEPLGYLDGAGVLWRARPNVAFGAAGGRGSDLGVKGFSSNGLRAGGWVEVGTAASPSRFRWRGLLSAGFMGDSSLTRRQYVAQRLDLWPTRTSVFYQSVEVDFNPGWKQDMGEGSVTLTAWSLGGSMQIQPRLWGTVAFDSRRPLILPEQRFVPTLPPLDRYTGVHVSTRYAFTIDQSAWLGGSVRRRDRDGTLYESWDVGMNSRRIVSDVLSGGLHAYGYSDGSAWDVNSDATFAARVQSWATVEASGGYGATLGTVNAATSPEYRSRWIRAGLDLRGPQGSWVRLAHEWQGGGPGNELTAELGLTF